MAIVTKFNNPVAIDAGRKIAEYFKTRNVQVFSVNNIDRSDVILVSPEKIRDLDLDLVFAVGGDGTTLRTFRMVPNMTPVFSINIGGTRGILAEVGHSDIGTQLEAIVKDEDFLDSRIRLQAQIEGKILGPALNDVVITRVNLTRTPYTQNKSFKRTCFPKNGRYNYFYTHRFNRTLTLIGWTHNS